MIAPPTGTRVWIVAGVTDMRRGFDGLASIVQEKLLTDPFAGHVFVFRGRRGDQSAMVGWRWTLSLCQASRAWPLHLATSSRRIDSPIGGSTVDAPGRHRLASAEPHLATGTSSVNSCFGGLFTASTFP